MAVGLGSGTPFLIEADPFVGLVPPRVVLTIFNTDGTNTVRVTRSAGGETQLVQGGRSLQVTDVGLLTDWAAPLNVNITYTVSFEGVAQSTVTVFLPSDVAWLQDPLNPLGAIPVESDHIVPGHLLLDSKAVSSATYANQGTELQVMGSKYPHFFAGRRQAASDVQLSMWSDDEDTEFGFRSMLADAPILLFRPLPRHRLLPPVCYISAAASEDQRTVRLGQNLTHWDVSGNLVQAVWQAVVSGVVTYDEVQALLGGYSYDEVRDAARSTVYLDWQRNPLIFSNL